MRPSPPRRHPGRPARPLVLPGLAAIGVLAAFGPPPGTPFVVPPTPPEASGLMIRVVPESVAKVCQLIGETDRENGRPTVNRTESAFGFWGSDLGIPVRQGERLRFLFGDTHPRPGIVRPRDADLIATVVGRDADGCLRLDFPRDADGAYRPMAVPGISMGPFEVPTGGFALGDRLYVSVSTDHGPGRPMGRSVLARSIDGGEHFTLVGDLSRERFINTSWVVVPAGGEPELPLPSVEEAVLAFGTGPFRASPPFLMSLPGGRVEEPAARRYFAGLNGDRPVWSAREEEARPLFDAACMGELSASYSREFKRWILLYNCADGGGRSRILMRTAERPWGPWSDAVTLFDPHRDGDCRFIQAAGRPADGTTRASACREVGDPHRPFAPGDAYGAYLIPSMTTAVPGGAAVYFTLSTWNPYTVVLMRAELKQETQIAILPAAAPGP